MNPADAEGRSDWIAERPDEEPDFDPRLDDPDRDRDYWRENRR